MKILISNDDGCNALGLRTLNQELDKIADVYVIAPDRNRSACSSSLTTRESLHCHQYGERQYRCNGTPADCVHLGINGFLDIEPDLVVAGINHGENMGDDVLYSGTLAAALEGRFLQRSSIAVSLSCLAEQDEVMNFATAARVMATLVAQIDDLDIPPGVVLNVNVPNIPLEKILGLKITRLGCRTRSSNISRSHASGRTSYNLGQMGLAQEYHPLAHPDSVQIDTDFFAVRNGYVSITPISADMTYVSGLSALSMSVDDLDRQALKIKA